MPAIGPLLLCPLIIVHCLLKLGRIIRFTLFPLAWRCLSIWRRGKIWFDRFIRKLFLIIGCAFVFTREAIIGLGHTLEDVLVAAWPIRVILLGQLTIRLFNVGISRGACDAKRVVVIQPPSDYFNIFLIKHTLKTTTLLSIRLDADRLSGAKDQVGQHYKHVSKSPSVSQNSVTYYT